MPFLDASQLSLDTYHRSSAGQWTQINQDFDSASLVTNLPYHIIRNSREMRRSIDLCTGHSAMTHAGTCKLGRRSDNGSQGGLLPNLDTAIEQWTDNCSHEAHNGGAI